MNIPSRDDFATIKFLTPCCLYKKLKISHNAQRGKWSIDELIIIIFYIQEQNGMSCKRAERAHLIVTPLARKVITIIRNSSLKEERIRVTPITNLVLIVAQTRITRGLLLL